MYNRETWADLLLPSIEKDYVELFTTNYDLVLDSMCKDMGMLTGSQFDGQHATLGLENWSKASLRQHPSTFKGMLTKLHGSVDWQYDEKGRIIIGSPNFSGDRDRHPILYPGFKETPNKRPFNLFYDHLKEAVSKTSLAIVIGFSFKNDDYIKNILGTLQCQKVYITLNEPGQDSLAQDDYFKEWGYFDKGFTRETLNEVRSIIDDLIS